MTEKFLARLLDEASRPYRAAGHFAYGFSRGKLSSDCIFRELLRRGVFPAAGGRFLDLGCGQAGLASWLLAARKLFESGDWPADWPEPPRVAELRGFELMAKDVARGRAALADREPQVVIRQGDICKTDFGRADIVTILDVLHYIDHPNQEDILRRVRAALPPGGVFLTRVGDAEAGLYFHVCDWVDRAVTFVRGHRLPTLYYRSLADWAELLRKLGFEVETVPMSEGKPFANVMLVARVPV
ncbi:MAG: class I SAM-dependent methyltransferase [Gammaproteobacteria bacterium]|nr:class I SAM-dependent methyltransferase [Gammaproteobacteria bacterium]MBU1415998.1 class I SAM-dependent methyltransferase [Gammaproteobacteria bacterium]